MNEYQTNLAYFYNSLLTLKELFKKNIITEDELHHLEGMMRAKYGIKDNSVFCLNTVAI